MSPAGREANHQRKGPALASAQASLDWPATLMRKGAAPLAREHLRFAREAAGSQGLRVVLIDLSASMLRSEQLALAKGCLLALSNQAYQSRERLLVIGFGGAVRSGGSSATGLGALQAQQGMGPESAGVVLLHPAGKPRALNLDWIAPLTGGGGTPVQAAMVVLRDCLQQEAKRSSGLANGLVKLWLLSDGRFTPLPQRPEGVSELHIVDFEHQALRLNRCAELAALWGASCTSASDWQA